MDVFFVEAGERAKEYALIIGQKYTTRNILRKTKRIGNPLFLGLSKNLVK